MKKSFLKQSVLAAMVAVAMTLGFSSCDKDDKKDDKVIEDIVLDGIYFKGAGSALATLNAKGQLKSTKNEEGQVDRAELMEIYVAIKANSTFNLIEVKGAERITYGPGAGFGAVEAYAGEDKDIKKFPEFLENDEPQLGLQRGAIVESDATFKVTEDGLYHIVYDKELKVGAIAKADWGVIGAATPNGWNGSTQLEAEFDLNKMEFKNVDSKGIVLKKGDYKFRYSHGWKVFLNEEPKVNVNTNFGGTLEALTPGGSDMGNTVGGLYAVTLTWELGKDYTVKIEKIGDLVIVDYSAYELGVIGNAYYNADGVVDENWGANYPGSTKIPAKDGNIYTWNFPELELLEGGFKIRQNENWDGFSLGYNNLEIKGDAVDNFEDDGGNIKVIVAGTYDLVLVINAETDTYTLTINKK